MSLLVGPISAATSTVSGTLTFREKIAPRLGRGDRHDRRPYRRPRRRRDVGQQRIDAPGTVPVAFSVFVDDAAIDKTHAYGLYASIVDGTTTWQNAAGEPVITGGPTSGIA